MHDRAFFDLGLPSTTGAAHLANDLFDHQLDVGSFALEAHDRDVFETHQGGEDLTRVQQDEGASWLLAHTTSLKRLRLILGDPAHQGLPAEIRRAGEVLAIGTTFELSANRLSA
jgi:hypothetical protein